VHVDAKDLPHYAKTVWLFLLSTARYCCAVETTSIYIEKPENIFFYKTYFSSHFSLLQQMKKTVYSAEMKVQIRPGWLIWSHVQIVTQVSNSRLYAAFRLCSENSIFLTSLNQILFNWIKNYFIAKILTSS